jgi:hypothetical protein
MKIYFVFSRNKKIGSRLISWASGKLLPEMQKVPSHVAVLIEFDESAEPFVIESIVGHGVRIIPLSCWLNINELCYKIPCKTQFSVSDISFVLVDIWDKKYDKMGILFFSYCFLMHFIFKTPFPEKNKWQSDDRYFCTEAAAKLTGYKKHGMVTPAKMCHDLMKAP